MSREGVCHWCWRRGHTIRSCNIRKSIASAAEQMISEGKEETLPYRYRRALEIEQRYKNIVRRPSRCSYCLQRHQVTDLGHNRRNCPRMQKDMQQMIIKNKAWRKEALSLIVERNLTVGSLVEDFYYGASLITDIHWDNICLPQAHCNVTWDMREKAITLTTVSSLATGKSENFNIAWSTIEATGKESSYYVCGSVPVSREEVIKSAPDGWLEGKTGLKHFFSRKADKQPEWARKVNLALDRF